MRAPASRGRRRGGGGGGGGLDPLFCARQCLVWLRLQCRQDRRRRFIFIGEFKWRLPLIVGSVRIGLVLKKDADHIRVGGTVLFSAPMQGGHLMIVLRLDARAALEQ